MKSSTSFCFSSSLLFFFVAFTAVNSQIVDDCMYRLAFKTGTVAEAGTDSIIGVQFSSVEIPDLLKYGDMPPGHEYFQNGNLDFFLFREPKPCLNLIRWITVTSDGSGQKPKWYLKYVKALASAEASPIVVKFEFDQWLAIDEPPYELTATRVGSISRDGLSNSTINKSINDF